jgi:putative flavoprotein involved in K+ transport
MTRLPSEHQLNTVVVGGGQAGLAMGYYLAAQHRDFVILDAAGRVGDTWRNRWDSLRLFTLSRVKNLRRLWACEGWPSVEWRVLGGSG